MLFSDVWEEKCEAGEVDDIIHYFKELNREIKDDLRNKIKIKKYF